MDLQSIRQSIDGNVRGTLGVDFLQRFIVTIDFDQALVHLREPGRFRPDGPRVARSFENSVGLDWLSRFQVSLDFPNRRVMLKRGKRFDEPFSRATSGLAIIDVDGRKFIAQVRPDSPASLAGLSEGDEVVRIGSKQADELDMFTVRKALTENVGEVVTLTIRRGAREFSATIQLADRLN